MQGNAHQQNPEWMKCVSIILPIRNESRHIHECIDAIIHQTYPHNLIEILVVDGQSTDATREIVQGYQVSHPNIRLLDNPQQIVPTALNIGIQNSKGEIILRVDGHTKIASDYVMECVMALARTGADNVGGKMTGRGETPFGEAVVMATSSPFGIGNSRFHYSEKEEEVDSVYLGAWPREVFKKNGLFNESMVRDQDDEFNYRLRKSGGTIYLVPQISSLYTVRGSSKKLWNQYFEYGFWKVKVFQLHPRQMSYRHFIPAIFVSSLAILSVLSLISRTARKALALVSSLYLTANLFSSALTARKQGWKNIKYLPIVFAILHVSYGSGFLFGLLKLLGGKK